MLEQDTSKGNVTWFKGFISREDRERLHGHVGAVVWFTGLPASGKSTIAHHLERILYEAGCSTYVFDGDNVRHGLCSDLGFSPEHRRENIRRIGEMTKLFVEAGVIAIAAFISPYRSERREVRRLIGPNRFLEIYVRCPLEICAARDPKGLYERAKRGEIQGFTGISSPYEVPEEPDMILDSDRDNAVTAAERVFGLIRSHRFVQ
jgi:adenylylsulfate kinase